MNQFDTHIDHKIDMPIELFDTFNRKGAKNYKVNQIIYRQGEIAEAFYFLKKGRVQVFVNSPEGMEKILFINKPGQVFGVASFFDGYPRISSARTLENSEIITITKSDILAFFQDKPALALNLIELLAKKIRLLSKEINDISFLSVDKRIAQYLLSRNQNEDGLVYCTQEDIAKAVGVSRVSVSRTLGNFVKYKWIDTNYKKIILLKPDEIQKYLEN